MNNPQQSAQLPEDPRNDAIEYGAILQQWEKGIEVDVKDLLPALVWRCQNHGRNSAR